MVTLLHSESNLRSSLTPFYLELFNAIARLEGGIKFLVDLRADLLASATSVIKHRYLSQFTELHKVRPSISD